MAEAMFFDATLPSFRTRMRAAAPLPSVCVEPTSVNCDCRRLNAIQRLMTQLSPAR